jgi:FMN phosphatase YigB (HAD superfamily)
VSDAFQAILFDFGGTLDADGLPWKDRFFDLARAEGLATRPEDFDPAFYAADDSLVGRIERAAALGETVERLSTRLASALGAADPEAGPRMARRFTAAARERLVESSRLLSRLSARYRLGIVSNFYGNLEAVCEEAGLAPFLSAAIDSAVVGAEKPDPRIFRAALERLAVEPARAVFVGDSPSRDMAGARALGMPHVRVVAAGRPASPCCPGDALICRLADLEEALA